MYLALSILQFLVKKTTFRQITLLLSSRKFKKILKPTLFYLYYWANFHPWKKTIGPSQGLSLKTTKCDVFQLEKRRRSTRNFLLKIKLLQLVTFPAISSSNTICIRTQPHLVSGDIKQHFLKIFGTLFVNEIEFGDT